MRLALACLLMSVAFSPVIVEGSGGRTYAFTYSCGPCKLRNWPITEAYYWVFHVRGTQKYKDYDETIDCDGEYTAHDVLSFGRTGRGKKGLARCMRECRNQKAHESACSDTKVHLHTYP